MKNNEVNRRDHIWFNGLEQLDDIKEVQVQFLPHSSNRFTD